MIIGQDICTVCSNEIKRRDLDASWKKNGTLSLFIRSTDVGEFRQKIYFYIENTLYIFLVIFSLSISEALFAYKIKFVLKLIAILSIMQETK